MKDDATPRELPDAEARRAILNDLDTNMVVEAAAGTGKTTCLVGRLMNLFRRGALRDGRALAAVTFTHKAAAELRERLERELAVGLGEADMDPAERENLARAASLLGDCHIGTIHSFCARLLRERPVEAGIGPDFRELEETDDLFLRRRAWRELAEALPREHGGLYRIFETFELDLDTLGDGFEQFAEYPDIEEWPGGDQDVGQIDIPRFMKGVERFRAGLERFRPVLEDTEGGTDQLIPVMQVLDRRFPRLRHPLGLAEAFRLSKLFPANPRATQKQWLPFGLGGADVKDEHAAYRAFWEETVRPFREQCLSAVYGAALEAFRLARDVYDRLRRDGGVLNFQDLLMATAAMLREYPEVRADLATRFDRLLVDEVQDTDPIQAEIMFLLTSSDGRRRDWHRCRPRPGSLFIVGDPKQSIYRFRRADIVVYQEVKRLVAESGGRVLGLSANFRSQPDVLDWVNHTFCHPENRDISPEAVAESGRFAVPDSPYSPGYVPLLPGLPAAADDCFHGVFYLETLSANKKTGIGGADILKDEAARIAAFIRSAVDGGLLLPSRQGPRPAEPSDFLIVTYYSAPAGIYANAVRGLGLDCAVSTGDTLAGSPALMLLRDYLLALAAPDDPVLLTAVLRGALWGVSDVDLYRWKKAGGRFDFLSRPPEADSPVAEALGQMREHHRLFVRSEPVSALDRVADDLGLWPYSCLAGDPAMSAGVLATALEQLRRERASIPTLGKLTERLTWLMDNFDKEPLPARELSGQAVRVMNLHKTKGLEAPVVFLTSTRNQREHKAALAVKRRDGVVSGGMALLGGAFGNAVLASPAGWEEMAAEEELFQTAEKTRLNYVAATRAGAALVVSVHSASKTWKSAFLPEFRPGVTIENTLPEPAGPPPAGRLDLLSSIDAAALEKPARLRESERPAMLAESYRSERAKPDLLPGVEMEDSGGEEAMELGEILHRLLGDGAAEDELAGRAAELLRDYGLSLTLSREMAEMVVGVRRSDVYRRARVAEKVFRETPFAVRLERDGEALVQRGVIDLVFRESGGWVVVDYKSDRFRLGMDWEGAAERHAGQLAAYAQAWEKITGEAVVETGVYFLRAGRYVVVS